MDKETLYKNAVKIMREQYNRVDSPEMQKGADWNANRIKTQMLESELFTEKEAEKAQLEAKFYKG
jgi:hypothetical protein